MPVDFTEDFHSNPPAPTPHEPKTAPDFAPSSETVPVVSPAPPQPKALPAPPRRKRGFRLAPLLVLLALGGAGFLGWQQWQARLATQRENQNQVISQRDEQKRAALKARMRTLWKQGALAKQKGDFARARQIWQSGLELDPNNRGFKESLDKLNSAKNSTSPDDAVGR